jgi:ferredoxin
MPAKVNPKKCTGCETCIAQCPSEAISMEVEKAQVDIDNCIECGVCVEACSEEAIGME